jgi:hypothetical protein
MIEVEILPGLRLLVDPDKFIVQGGMSFALSEQWSSEVVITLDASLRDVLEGNESKVDGVVTLRTKP